MNTRLKSRLLCKEPLNNRSITELPGVGPTTGKRLSDNGYKEIMDVFSRYKKYRNNKLGFQKWMKNVCSAKTSQSEDCYNFFQLWETEFGETDTQTLAPEKSNKRLVKFNETKTKNAVPVKKRKPSVQFDKTLPTNVDSIDEDLEELHQEPAPQKQEINDPLKDFFVSKMHVVRTLPFILQIKVKKSISKIIFEAENEALENEKEPVPSTSTAVNGAPPRRSRSTEELLKNLQDLV